MMLQFFSSFYRYLTYFLSPPCCLSCKVSLQERQPFCLSCLLLITPIVPFDFYVGKDRMIKVVAISGYKEPLRSLIVSKHHGNETNVRMLADFMAAQPVLAQLDFDVITFIPLHWTRYASRGFNQAQIIAQAVSLATGKPVSPYLVRSKKTEFQTRLSLQQREQNLLHAFSIDVKYNKQIAGKKILLVDDLFTTGSTIKAAVQALSKYQPAKIEVFVACRVVHS